jgi:mono/diheme cytochrome c family protein
MTVQEVDQVVAYIHEIQQTQADAFGKADGAVTQALARIETGAAVVAKAVFEQEAVIADIEDTPVQFAAVQDFPDRVTALLAGDGTCTDESAAMVGSSCTSPGFDGDRDGLSDLAELALTMDLAPVINEVVVVRRVVDIDGTLSVEKIQNASAFSHLYDLTLDRDDPFSMSDTAGRPVADLDTVEAFVQDLNTAHLNLRVITERQDRFLEAAEKGLAALQAAAAEAAWEVDFAAVASDTGLSMEEAQRAVGLFNAYCARCHTAGYSAGVAFEQEPGSGAWAPALTGGRSVVQFPDVDDQVDFVIRGSKLAEAYGVNGLGRGWMPGFGQVLSDEDIRLIVAFERSL